MGELKSRHEVDEKYTWDLTPLFESESACEIEISDFLKHVSEFASKYEGKLDDLNTAVTAIDDFRQLVEKLVPIGTYASLRLSADQSDAEAQKLSTKVSNASAKFSTETSFLRSDLLAQDESF